MLRATAATAVRRRPDRAPSAQRRTPSQRSPRSRGRASPSAECAACATIVPDRRKFSQIRGCLVALADDVRVHHGAVDVLIAAGRILPPRGAQSIVVRISAAPWTIEARFARVPFEVGGLLRERGRLQTDPAV